MTELTSPEFADLGIGITPSPLLVVRLLIVKAQAKDLIARLQRANIEFERSSFVVLSPAPRQ